VLWFTGLSGSGRSTIANALEKQLYAQGRSTYVRIPVNVTTDSGNVTGIPLIVTAGRCCAF
jgi:thymidylate kinase